MADREDWTLFRTVEGLQQKAGVSERLLRRLVLKELGDNALDTGTTVEYGYLGDDRYYIENGGHGLDGSPEEIASLFSIRRPMRSSKLFRRPQRGALGNGLRVVAGAVLASEGTLVVTTRNRRITLRPEVDGSTTVVDVTEVPFPVGTRIEIGFGTALPRDRDSAALHWVDVAWNVADDGAQYTGKASPFWYDAAQFHELLLAHGSQPLRGLIAQLDGCTGGRAGEIVTAANLDRMSCGSVTRGQATALLEVVRRYARPVSADRLGCIGRDAFPERYYAVERGTADMGSAKPQAHIPFVVEAWARRNPDGFKPNAIKVTMLVNRTPVIDDINAYRDRDKDLTVVGCGLRHYCSSAPKRDAYDIRVNVTTPYCPITSDGKAPNLEPFADEILIAIEKATRAAQRAAPKDKRITQKEVVLDNLDEVIKAVSGDGEYRFLERQILYKLRPIVREETGKELRKGNFKDIITDYENEYGEIAGMYRDPRGSIYHPHIGENIQLGTLTVEEYERPMWLFNKLVYIEKEGWKEALKADGWPERHDCTLISSKGFTTRAARDLVDKLAEHDEPCTIYCVHDADAFGTMIYQTFQEATKARGARKIKIINLGLEPWEAIEMGLEVEDLEDEDLEAEERRKPVADYVRQHDGEWEEWLQTQRVELNAMTTPEFIAWLDRKMEEHGNGKLIPPRDVITAELKREIEAKVRADITERILREASYEHQVAAAIAAIKVPNSAAVAQDIAGMAKSEPANPWRHHIDNIASGLVAKRRIKGRR
jgi:hypothetical protein